MRKSSQIIATIFLIYHLTVVIVLANGQSMLGRELYPFISGYANTLGLNTTWQFFSPNPSNHRYIEYEVMSSSSAEDFDLDAKVFQWPPKEKAGIWHENYFRRIYHSMRTTFTREKAADYLVPYLCRKHPEAYAIVLRMVAKQIPSIEKAKVIETNFIEMSEVFGSRFEQFECEESPL